MEIKKGIKKKNYGKDCSIVDIEFDNDYILHVFQGKLSENDILIRYTSNGKRMRTPKHIHWAVDLLLKLEGNTALTKDFIFKINNAWDNSKGIKIKNDFKTLTELIEKSFNEVTFRQFKKLNKFGEYEIDFLFVLMQLLIIQEKTNKEDAYMFKKVIEKLLEDELDIFSIMSSTGHNGR